MFANRRVESTTLLQQAAALRWRRVESQDAQIAAQNAVTTALIDYQEAALQLMLEWARLDTELGKSSG